MRVDHVGGEPLDLSTDPANLSNVRARAQIELRGLYPLTPESVYEGVVRLSRLDDRDDADAMASSMEARRRGPNDRLESPDRPRSRHMEYGEASMCRRTITHQTYR